MAPCGQVAVHRPQPWQTVSMTWAFCSPRISTSLMAPKGQQRMHLPQSTQRRMSTWAICGSLSSLSRAKSASTLAAAAEPWATEAGMSLAPWQTPARNTPAVLVSTGLSFTWLSMKKP